MKHELSNWPKRFNALWDEEFNRLSDDEREAVLASPDGGKSADFAVKIERMTQVSLSTLPEKGAK